MDKELETHRKSINSMFILTATVFIFFMQSGFALLETGSIRRKNHTNILLKNITDIVLGAIVFFYVGFGLAYGNNTDSEGNKNV